MSRRSRRSAVHRALVKRTKRRAEATKFLAKKGTGKAPRPCAPGFRERTGLGFNRRALSPRSAPKRGDPSSRPGANREFDPVEPVHHVEDFALHARRVASRSGRAVAKQLRSASNNSGMRTRISRRMRSRSPSGRGRSCRPLFLRPAHPRKRGDGAKKKGHPKTALLLRRISRLSERGSRTAPEARIAEASKANQDHGPGRRFGHSRANRGDSVGHSDGRQVKTIGSSTE
jgi:hypothetical protein